MKWLALLLLCGCTGIAWNTTLAQDAGVRAAMVAFVRPGITTEGEMTARWGKPTQIIREGAQRTLVWRDMANPPGLWPLRYGDSVHYVLVTFQYGIATGAVSSDTDGCRATFPPWPPGPGFDNPSTVQPAGACAGAGAGAGTGSKAGATERPGVPADSYPGPGKGG